MVYEIIAQAIGIAAMVGIVGSFQQKTHKAAVAWQCAGSALFVVNMLMLGAISGALMNLVGAVRSLLFMNREKIKNHIKVYVGVFLAIIWIFYFMVFTVFEKEVTPANIILELLPTIGMSITTVGFSMKKAKNVRVAGLLNSPPWLIYNAASHTIGGVLCELLNCTSIIIGFIRLDRKGTENKAEEK